MRLNHASIFIAVGLALAFSSLTSCNKDGAPGAKGPNAPAFDTAQKGKEVQIAEKDHHIFLRPKVGSTQRYHIINKTTYSQSNVEPGATTPTLHNSVLITDYWLRQTVRSIKPDSSIDFTFKLDSILVSSTADTQKVSYSSNRAADKKDKRFDQFTMIVGQEFGGQVSRQGDLMELYGLTSISNLLLASAPDSIKTQEKYKQMATDQVKRVLSQYVIRAIAHVPEKPLAKDSSWTNHGETNLPVSDAIQFPVTIDSKETVVGFEERNGVVMAILEATTTTSPNRASLENGPVTIRLKDFNAGAKSSVRLEDLTGILVYRKVSEHRRYVVTVESKEQPGKTLSSSQDANDATTVELLQ